NLLSTEIADAVAADIDGVRQLQVRLLSQIGQPIDRPHVADISVVTADGVALADVRDDIAAIADAELGNVTSLTRRLIGGELSTF
ncbi:MAG: S-adenosylmethionine synthetase, partial [Halovenus sp.]